VRLGFTVVPVGLSGFLYVAIVVGWAVYLVPFALKRYDEAARNRSIDRFSSAMRVLGRHDGSGDDADVQNADMHDVEPRAGQQRTAVDPKAQRAAARTAARRRRRVLLLMMFATAATGTAAWFFLLPMWSVAIPATLLLVWLVLCPLQARRERRARTVRSPRNESLASRQPRVADDAAEMQPATGARSSVQADHLPDEAAATARPVDAEMPAPADEEPTVVLQRSSEPVEADGAVGPGSLWDPVPVTLPTYVHKPRAPRTIRTIDLGSVGVQSSGRADDAARTGHTAAHSGDAGAEVGAAENGAGDESRATSARAVGE
jgi:hypothetical protein